MPTLQDIRNKVRRVTGKLSDNQITDPQIDTYINNYYIYDFPAELKLETLRSTYQFITQPNIPVYDFDTEFFIDNMPPVYIGGYQSYMTQSRENFFRVNPQLALLQQSADTGNGTTGPYQFYLTNTPVMRGFKPNPPGAYSSSNVVDVIAPIINWNVLISGQDANNQAVNLVDDGGGTSANKDIGFLYDPEDGSTTFVNRRGYIDYITGEVFIYGPGTGAGGFKTAIANGASINAQYIPYVASRPQSVVFYQDQFIIYPVPDQAYIVSFECYKRPYALGAAGSTPVLNEWWQALAYGAADRIFADNGDLENLTKFRPLLEEQLKLVQRRTIVQQASERVSSIYTEQANFPQFPFGNLFSGF